MDDKRIITPDSYNIDQSLYNKAHADKFQILLNLPKALIGDKSSTRSNSTIDFDALQFSIYGSVTPDIIVPAVGQEYQGQELKISSHSRVPYENVFVEFDVDNLYRNWWVVYTWLNLLNDERFSKYNALEQADGPAWEAMKQYTTDFTIFGLDEYNNKVIQFEYEGCFPVSLEKVSYSDRDPEVLKSGFEFAFTFFRSVLV